MMASKLYIIGQKICPLVFTIVKCPRFHFSGKLINCEVNEVMPAPDIPPNSSNTVLLISILTMLKKIKSSKLI